MREQSVETNAIGLKAYEENFTKAHNLKRLALGFGVIFGCQCTSTLVIDYYAVSLYSSIGYTIRRAFLLSAGYVTVSILGNAITATLVDRGGRVNLLRTAAGTIAFLFMHIFFYASFLDATTAIDVSEIFPTRLRARYYIVFTVLTFTIAIRLWLFFLDTEGLSLEEVAKVFDDPITAGTHVVGKDGDFYVTTNSSSNKPEDDIEDEEHFSFAQGLITRLCGSSVAQV
ncbi:uncharacterized protein Z519_09762 [Cladophialophora bantiana CBS 173.52]|uniref:Major facilitator superfamily (MFS) profile domain-containing protein n=1 Tax=Cladophialophora bantiana (strain ATCC 10958 / CBS 173.52 / CDC B-1940 / NIH 8579) TaxID=1442370 RepID=A0A0D2EHR7_CLAB1|nr:uncharacterized protein Z519_09762 [Cladophialophora bantiana CBS 173.52]KIW89606.1 hypothetical protein Z519_09762 [Cladophialophora bantiana CBS 173.52]